MQLEQRNCELAEGLDQRSARAEVLRVISENPADLSAVFGALAEAVRRLSDAQVGSVACYVGAQWLEWITGRSSVAGQPVVPPDGAGVIGEVMREGRPREGRWSLDEGTAARFPATAVLLWTSGWNEGSFSATPRLVGGQATGATRTTRRNAGPFTGSQKALLDTVAAQAVTAIENARLFREQTQLLETVTRQAEDLGTWNLELEARVQEKVQEVERLRVVQRFLAPSLPSWSSRRARPLSLAVVPTRVVYRKPSL